MPDYYVPLPAAKVPANALLDFSPLERAADSYKQGQQFNAMLAYRQQHDARADARAASSDARSNELMDMRRTEFGDDQSERHAKAIGGVVQSVLDAPPEQRSAIVDTWRKMSPGVDAELKNNNIDFSTVDQWGPSFVEHANGYQSPLAKRKAEADVKYTESRADFYANGGRGGAPGPRERIITKLMDDDPSLTYSQALALSQRAPQDSSMAANRLAIDAARNNLDPSDVDAWSTRFNPQKQNAPAQRSGSPQGGLPDFTSPTGRGVMSTPQVAPGNFQNSYSPSPGAATSSPGSSQNRYAPRGSHFNPVVPRSQTDIDNAPPGTVFSIDGKLMVK